MKTSLHSTISLVLVIIAAFSGCKHKNDSELPRDTLSDTSKTTVISDSIAGLLSKKGIVPENVTAEVSSPDSQYIALAIDSTVRFGPGDEMWSDELPSDWYGIRNRKILYLYNPSVDTLHKLAECEEIVNFYLKSTSQPVQAERKERFAKVLWSPDSRKILLLKDRESEARQDQDALIFVLAEDNPTFLEMFSVWQGLMRTYNGATGTKVTNVDWVDDSTVRIVFAVRGIPASVHLEVIFNANTGKPTSSKEIPLS